MKGYKVQKLKKNLYNISHFNRFIWSDCLINLSLKPIYKEIKRSNCSCFNENIFLVSILFYKEKLDSDSYLILNTNGLDEIYWGWQLQGTVEHNCYEKKTEKTVGRNLAVEAGGTTHRRRKEKRK